MQLHRARKEFEKAGIALAAIGHGTPEQAAAFRRAQGIEIRLLVDSDRRTYELAGAKVATLRELLAPRIVARGAKHTMLSRLRLGSIAVHQGAIIGHHVPRILAPATASRPTTITQKYQYIHPVRKPASSPSARRLYS